MLKKQKGSEKMGKLNIDKMNKSFYGSLKKDIPSKKENNENPNQDERILQIMDKNLKDFMSPEVKEFWYNKGEKDFYDNQLQGYQRLREDWIEYMNSNIEGSQ